MHIEMILSMGSKSECSINGVITTRDVFEGYFSVILQSAYSNIDFPRVQSIHAPCLVQGSTVK